jgi:urease accessory protein
MRGERPFVFTNIRDRLGLPEIAQFIIKTGGLPERTLP